jgi:hypothetical protein
MIRTQKYGVEAMPTTNYSMQNPPIIYICSDYLKFNQTLKKTIKSVRKWNQGPMVELSAEWNFCKISRSYPFDQDEASSSYRMEACALPSTQSTVHTLGKE